MLKTTVPSQSQPNITYEVSLTEKGWHCTCPAFLFGEKKKGFCKHVVDAQVRLEQKVAKA